ncbi:MAG TPA: O-antigen ligase family protein, partial [Pyrinomonadaceae bacterium]|nr:O-antigen ligase family protein [Pyrinomonadaceae bacterium]
PHSIAGAWMGLSAVVGAWLLRLLATRRAGLRRTPLDLPLWLFAGWTVLSSLLSYEPRVSTAKLLNVATLLVFYVTQAVLTRRAAVLVACVLLASGASGVLRGAWEIAVGRGVVVKALRADSPLRAQTPLREGDAVWRVGGRRVSSVEEIDAALRATPRGQRASLSVITSGEHAEWQGPLLTEEARASASPSGVTGGGPTRSFRASGWTSHYETFAEMLQMIAQLALGFALAFRRRDGGEEEGESGGRRRHHRPRALLAFAAYALLAAGVAMTAMRTVLVAFAVGSTVLAWRSAERGRARAGVAVVVLLALAFGAVAVWRTRASGALLLQDPSANLRFQVASVAASRVPLHPFFGHGMDAVKRHWQEWGFPGSTLLHAHSTPVQLAFDRGLPALLFWLWLMLAFWRLAARAETLWRDTGDAAAHGLALGVLGALTGFLASSLVNYNFGDAEAALLVWWMMGATVVLNSEAGGAAARDGV